MLNDEASRKAKNNAKTRRAVSKKRARGLVRKSVWVHSSNEKVLETIAKSLETATNDKKELNLGPHERRYCEKLEV